MATLEKFSSSLGQQIAFNQQTDQRIANLMNRFDTFETRFNNLEHLMKETLTNPKSVSSSESSSQDTPGSHHLDSTPKSDAVDLPRTQQLKPKTTWASIASRPSTPLTNRKRQALYRFFNPPTTDSTQNGSYTFIEISIDNLRVLDLTFPARNTIGVLLHEAYVPEFQLKLLKIDSNLIQDFDPLDHCHTADPKHQDLPEDRRIQLAKALHQDRCIRTLYFIRPHLVPGVAKYFIRQRWASSHIATDITHQWLPRPVKRRPEPHSFVAQTLQAPQLAGIPSGVQGTASRVPPFPISRIGLAIL